MCLFAFYHSTVTTCSLSHYISRPIVVLGLLSALTRPINYSVWPWYHFHTYAVQAAGFCILEFFSAECCSCLAEKRVIVFTFLLRSIRFLRGLRGIFAVSCGSLRLLKRIECERAYLHWPHTRLLYCSGAWGRTQCTSDLRPNPDLTPQTMSTTAQQMFFWFWMAHKSS